MNILYCGDAGICQGVLVSILSLLKHNKEELHIYVLTVKYANIQPFPLKTVEFLDKLVKRNNGKNFVKLIDATEVFVANLPRKNMKSYFTPCSMLRLYLDKIPEIATLERVLYLDYDVVCRGDLAELYDTDLTGVEVAGVLDIYGKNFYYYHGLKQDYMNSGVLLFNIPKCLESRLFERAVQKCASRRMMLADQAALNKCIEARKILPRKFNEQGERPQKDTVLHHFSNNFKFWPIFRVQKVKPFETDKIHTVLKITEYDDLLAEFEKLKADL